MQSVNAANKTVWERERRICSTMSGQAMIAGYRTDQQIRMGKDRRVYAFILYPSQATQLSPQSHITTPVIGR